MTRDEVLKMAREANVYASHQTDDSYDWHQIRDERFAALVAAHEREACVMIVEHYTGAWSDEGYALTQAIRARNKE